MKQYTLVSADKYEYAASLPLVANFDPTTGDYYVATKVDGVSKKLHRLLTGEPKGKTS